MKKTSIIAVIISIISFPSYADVCYDVSENVARTATDILSKQNEIYSYCSICYNAESEIIKIKQFENGNPVRVNGNPIDLAHIYYKQGNKFINLGIASGCIEDGEYNIAAQLENLPAIHRTKESDKEQAKKLSQENYKICFEKAQTKESPTTSDMIEQNTRVNNCLTNIIKLEIENGFNSDQQKEMLETLNQIRKAVWKFYFGIYAENKYCYGECGTMSSILPYVYENKILMEMLEQVIYLNIAKNGY